MATHESTREHEAERSEDTSRHEDRRSEDTSFVQDLRNVPDDVREAVHDADVKLAEKLREDPQFRRVLDFRLLAAAIAGAFIVAFMLRLAGLSPLISIVLFVVLLGAAWFALVKYATPRDPSPKTPPTARQPEPQP